MYLEKAKKWINKTENGKDGYLCIQNSQEGYCYYINGTIHQVDEMYVCIRSKNKIVFIEQWKKNSGESDAQKMTILVKDMQKVIIINENEQAWGFGFCDMKQDAEMMICYKIDNVIGIMWAESKEKYINYADCYNRFDESTGGCLFSFFASPKTVTREEKTEVCENEEY